MKQNYRILIPDGHSTWAVSVLHCLKEFKRYEFVVLSAREKAPIKYSKYTHSYIYYDILSEIDKVKFIRSIIIEQHIDIILPIAEEEISFFIRNKTQFLEDTACIPLPNVSDFEVAIDKQKLAVFLENEKLPLPKSITYNGDLELIEQLNFPILIKPIDEKGGDGIVKLQSIEAFHKHLSVNPSNNLFIQEFIEGYDIDCSVICNEGEILAYTIQKGYLQGDTPFAPQLGLEFLPQEDILDVVKQLMKRLNWSGVAHIDLRFDQNQNDFKVIEINARFWGSVEASKVSGINFPYLSLQMALDKAVEAQTYRFINYVRFKGVLKYAVKKPWMLLNLKFLIQNTEVPSIVKDPLPTLRRFKDWLIRKGVN
ncbi:MAG: hypothetical protein BM564_00145 [Bacteroidetes bacterium MedPE-SWsnd-G2]|nr:MAG: hypothetical protein BM564_00145 [Bacteroidetes bacterium MedPE-SWsnd-G2]